MAGGPVIRHLVLIVLLCSGCQWLTPYRSGFEDPPAPRATVQEPIQDPRTSEVFTPLFPALTFERSEPHLTANGKDFLHLIPIQTSQNGYRVVYLWVGKSTSIDRGVANADEHAHPGKSSAALQINLHATGNPEDDDTVLPLVNWEAGRLLADLVDMPVHTHERTALSVRDLRTLIRNNPTQIVLLDRHGQSRLFHHKSGTWD